MLNHFCIHPFTIINERYEIFVFSWYFVNLKFNQSSTGGNRVLQYV